VAATSSDEASDAFVMKDKELRTSTPLKTTGIATRSQKGEKKRSLDSMEDMDVEQADTTLSVPTQVVKKKKGPDYQDPPGSGSSAIPT
jgi:hypothetical protein